VSLLDVYLDQSFQLTASFEQLGGDVGMGFVFSSMERERADYAQLARFDGDATFIMGYYQMGEYSGTASVKSPVIQPGSSHILELNEEY
jgi:hypothetical protein